jgi:hypothetical protein
VDSGDAAQDAGHSAGRPIELGGPPRPAARTNQHGLPLDCDGLNIDVSAHLGNARGRPAAGSIQIAARASGKERCIRGKLFAGGPGPRTGDDEPGVIGDDDRVELVFLSNMRKLVMKSDERVGTALPSTVFHKSHARSVSRHRRLGQLRVSARQRLYACAQPRFSAASMKPS